MSVTATPTGSSTVGLRPAALSKRGMAGGIRLRVDLIADRTRITELECRPPLQILRAHHVDPERPDLASVIVASPAGGILQGDELSIDIRVGRGARLRLGTQSATRIYRMPDHGARMTVRVEVEAAGHLEFLPDPFIPYQGSRFSGEATWIVAEDASLLAWETIAPGRVARGEVLAFEAFETRVEVFRPDGRLLATDAVVLDRGLDLRSPGLLGGSVALGTLFVVHDQFDPAVLRAAAATIPHPEVSVGASSLPAAAGAWLRVLADDSHRASAVLDAACAAARTALLGRPRIRGPVRLSR